MTTPERPWWSPEALAAREHEVRSAGSESETDIRNDFASYKALVNGGDTESSGLYMHNEVEPWRIDTVCSGYRAIVHSHLRRTPLSIADLGCGAGYTTDGLQRTWPSSTVTGFDVSVDAVQFARAHWPHCRFIDGAVSPEQLLTGAPFDVMLCQEFYPFTRTGSPMTHREWLRCLLNNMTTDGLAIIMVSAGTPDSINETYGELRDEFALRRIQIAAPRISRRLPFALARVAGKLLVGVKPAWVRHLFVLQPR